MDVFQFLLELGLTANDTEHALSLRDVDTTSLERSVAISSIVIARLYPHVTSQKGEERYALIVASPWYDETTAFDYGGSR